MNMKKIHIGGVYYGQHNIGDEAIAHSMINTFSKNNMVSISTYGSEWIEEIAQNVERHCIPVRYQKPKLGLIYTVPARNLFKDVFKVKREIDFYKTKDVYVCGGATILSDCPWYSLRTVELAGKAKCDVFLWGVGMAEVDDSDTLTYIRNVLNKDYVKIIFTRDEIVRERLLRIGVNSKKVAVSYDPAIMMDGVFSTPDKYLTEKQREIYFDDNPNIVLTISGETDVVKKTPIDVIKKAVLDIQVKYNANVFLIPTGCGKQCKDTEFLTSIATDLSNNRITVIKNEFTPKELVGFLKNVKLIISSRLHMNIFGVCASTPSIGLVRNKKIIDFAQIMGLPYLELDTLTVEQLVKQAENVLNNRDLYANAIDSKVKKMRAQYQHAEEMIGL